MGTIALPLAEGAGLGHIGCAIVWGKFRSSEGGRARRTTDTNELYIYDRHVNSQSSRFRGQYEADEPKPSTSEAETVTMKCSAARIIRPSLLNLKRTLLSGTRKDSLPFKEPVRLSTSRS